MNIIQWFPAISVILAITVFIWQIRMSMRQMKLQSFAVYTRRYQDIVVNLPTAIERDGFRLEDAADSERESILRWLRAYFDLCSEEHYLYENRLVDDTVWQLWRAGMHTSLQRAAYCQAWNTLRTTRDYSSSFRSFIDPLCADVALEDSERVVKHKEVLPTESELKDQQYERCVVGISFNKKWESKP